MGWRFGRVDWIIVNGGEELLRDLRRKRWSGEGMLWGELRGSRREEVGKRGRERLTGREKAREEVRGPVGRNLLPLP